MPCKIILNTAITLTNYTQCGKINAAKATKVNCFFLQVKLRYTWIKYFLMKSFFAKEFLPVQSFFAKILPLVTGV